MEMLDKQQQIKAVASIIQTLNVLPITGGNAEQVVAMKRLLNQIGLSIQQELQDAQEREKLQKKLADEAEAKASEEDSESIQ
jgi:Na+-transporting NADH:ubiquinone oxidoreductase subunit NqrC